MNNINTELFEALENMIGAFDTPIARRRIKNRFADEARKEARKIIEKIRNTKNNEMQ